MDELQRALLAQLGGGGDATAMPSLPDLVERSLGDDPMAAALVDALRRRQAAEAVAEPEDEEPSALADPEVADLLERLYAELEALRARTAALADALGACPRCFGDDLVCPVCRGRGRPGGREPHPRRFDEMIVPAVRRRRRSRGSPPAPAPHDTQEASDG
jgi:hypothetical protein